MSDTSHNVFRGALVAPDTYEALREREGGFVDSQGIFYPFVGDGTRVVDFIAPHAAGQFDRDNLEMYNSAHSVDIYRNFLNWLFETFDVQEEAFRAELLSHLRLGPGMRVLIAGCGLGEDIALVSDQVGSTGEVHAQDLSKAMVLEAASKNAQPHIGFTISNALHLPYPTGYFDAVFHFGGINLFGGDMRVAVAELDRVCKEGGRVVFGDEGIAAHLRGTEYYEVAVRNNALWGREAPMAALPYGARDVQLNYVLGNCFYLIGYVSGKTLPYMNIDVPHQGTRGGTARTRYFGQIEGVSAEVKAKLYAKARKDGVSAHDLLEKLLSAHL
ncbi:FIG00460785: hypothetical protein [plant metagenome]|uniref:Methyltransferase domain-containing protein n=1 Tax=plant metagenome TaxID=1297885 RepID=A0A484R6B7_9ZZZZ